MSTKRLRSVLHSTAHHAVSGLCYVHPHLGEHCKVLGLKEISVSLLTPEFDPPIEKLSKEIVYSTDALREKFREITQSEGMTEESFSSASARFSFSEGSWPSSCQVSVVTAEGISLCDEVAMSGHRVEARPANAYKHLESND